MAGKKKFIFIDESGTFDFKPERSRFFVLTAIVTENPFQGVAEMLQLRHELLVDPAYSVGTNKKRDLSHFHCTEDPQAVRDRVFGLICKLDFEAYSVVVHKNRTNPSLYEPEKFYKMVFKSLINTIAARASLTGESDVFASSFSIKGNKQAFLDGLDSAFTVHPKIAHRIYFHPTTSHHMLQVSDYVSWAIYRKWDKGDERSCRILGKKIKSDFPIFRNADKEYY